MKIANSNMLTKWATRKVDPAPDSATVLCDASVRVLALECWRIKKLMPEFAGNRKHLVVQRSVDKMIDALASLGVAIEDPEGSLFRDEMTVNVAGFDRSDQLETGQRIVTETLSPNIYIHEKLANPARVIVAVGTKSVLHKTQSD